MSVEIVIPPFLQPFTGDAKVVQVIGNTVGECLEELIKQYPALKPRLFTRKGELRQSINLFLNKEVVNAREPARPVREGDKLYITSIIMGG
jgi:molybdopterin converting factor small subunit